MNIDQKMNIYESIDAIMAECPAISKSQFNKNQSYKYRGIDMVMNVFQPLLAKYKVFISPEVLELHREDRMSKNGGNLIYTTVKVKYTFYAEDSSYISATVLGEGMDSADKSSNKAMSVAFKYALFQVFCIPTEEMQDPDAETPPESKPTYTDPMDAPFEFSPTLEQKIESKKATQEAAPPWDDLKVTPEDINHHFGKFSDAGKAKVCKQFGLSTLADMTYSQLDEYKRMIAEAKAKKS